MNSSPPFLRALSEGPNIVLDKAIILIGRHQECDVQIPSRKVSRRHCCLAQVEDHLVIRDLGSTNGVRINGVKVLEGNLQSGDELTIGNIRYQLKWEVQAHEPSDGLKQVIDGLRHGIAAQTVHPLLAEHSGDLPVPLHESPRSQDLPGSNHARDGAAPDGPGLDKPLRHGDGSAV